ncbi:hypothetical protein PMAYCL1PPCAC_06232, partial [Pristionchus mayeri]
QMMRDLNGPAGETMDEEEAAAVPAMLHPREEEMGDGWTGRLRIMERAMPVLSSHAYDNNGGSGQGRMKCRKCDKSISSTNFVYLRQHMRVHSTIEAYACPRCSQSFPFITTAKRHISKCAKGEEMIVNSLLEAQDRLTLEECFPHYSRELPIPDDRHARLRLLQREHPCERIRDAHREGSSGGTSVEVRHVRCTLRR